jgi:class 3 adenylate cyclase
MGGEATRIAPAKGSTGRMLTTIMFLDIVGSTERAAQVGDHRWGEQMRDYYAEVRRHLVSFGGREVNTFGDDFFALFDAPVEAVLCACAIRDAMLKQGLKIRAGVHTGECELDDGKITGIAVHIGARMVRQAEPGEVAVSSTVHDLVVGAGIGFDDRGNHSLKGVPGEWRVFVAQTPAVKTGGKR